MPLTLPACSFSVFSPLWLRRFLALAGATAWACAALPTPCVARGAFNTHALYIHDVPVPVPGLPRHLEGLTIAHITDTHLWEIGRLEERVITAVQARDPTLIVLTGQMLSARQALPILAEFCHALTAPGRHVLAVRGNHEVWSKVSVS